MIDAAILYPDQLPLDDAREIIRIIKGGNALAERALLAKSFWVLQGYTQGALLGDPDNLRVFAAAPPTEFTEDPVAVLERIVAQEEARRNGVMVPQALPAPLALLLQWAVQKLIELLMSELGIEI